MLTAEPPSRAANALLRLAQVSAATSWATTVAFLFARWGVPMRGTEVRMLVCSLAVTTALAAVWLRHSRICDRYEEDLTRANYRHRLDQLDRRLDQVDESVAVLAARSQRLSKVLEEETVIERPGEETGDVLRMPRPRQPHLRGLKSG